MPIYVYECDETGERFEEIHSLDFADIQKVRCKFHKEGLRIITDKHLATKVVAAPANIQLGKPTRVFINPGNGKTQIAISEHQPAPWGFQEVLLRDPIERAKFEKSEQQRLDVTNEIVTHQMETAKAESTKARHADINANMGTLAADSDNPTAAEALIKAAMSRPKKKKAGPRKSEGILAVNHMDSSNMQDVIK